MTDPLDLIWGSFDTPDPLFAAENVEWFPEGVFDRLLAMGLVVPAETTNFVTCPSCFDHVEEVLYLPERGGSTSGGRFVIPCAEAGCVTIPPDLMRQWQPDFQALARHVKDAMRIDHKMRVTERVPNQLWRLGTVEWKKTQREVFMARGLAWPNGDHLAELCSAGSIVLIGNVPPPSGIWPSRMPAVVPLPSVLSVDEGGALILDAGLLMSLVAEADEVSRLAASVALTEMKKRIAQLVEERLEQTPTLELIAAGVSQGMSTREIEQDMTDRGAPMDHSTVARKIQKVKSRFIRGS